MRHNQHEISLNTSFMEPLLSDDQEACLINWIQNDMTEKDINEIVAYIRFNTSNDEIAAGTETEPIDIIDLTDLNNSKDEQRDTSMQRIKHAGSFDPNAVIDLCDDDDD